MHLPLILILSNMTQTIIYNETSIEVKNHGEYIFKELNLTTCNLVSNNLGLPLYKPELDWYKENVVTQVKDARYKNNNYWSTSLIDAVESISAIYTGNLTTFSEQTINDYSTKDINCVYLEKNKISDVIKNFCSLNNLKSNYTITSTSNLNYTGSGLLLNSLGIKLNGLEHGLSNYVQN